MLNIRMSKYLLNVLVVLSFGATELYGQQLYPREAKDWGVLNKIIYSAYSSSKLTLETQETPNGALFLFELAENSENIRLVTHIVFNERNTSRYTELIQEIAFKVEAKLESVESYMGNEGEIIVIPLAIMDPFMNYFMPTVFHESLEVKKLMQFFIEHKEYDLRPILRVRQYPSHAWIKAKE